MDSTKELLNTWPWAGEQPKDERQLEIGSWPYALALAGRRAKNAMAAGLRYRVFKAPTGDWTVRRTEARPRRGEKVSA